MVHTPPVAHYTGPPDVIFPSDYFSVIFVSGSLKYFGSRQVVNINLLLLAIDETKKLMRLSQTMKSIRSSILRITTILRRQLISFGTTKVMFNNKTYRGSFMLLM